VEPITRRKDHEPGRVVHPPPAPNMTEHATMQGVYLTMHTRHSFVVEEARARRSPSLVEDPPAGRRRARERGSSAHAVAGEEGARRARHQAHARGPPLAAGRCFAHRLAMHHHLSSELATDRLLLKPLAARRPVLARRRLRSSLLRSSPLLIVPMLVAARWPSSPSSRFCSCEEEEAWLT
ncbi:hypothetical protein Dimus_037465, partial [Dionaea muscipula]